MKLSKYSRKVIFTLACMLVVALLTAGVITTTAGRILMAGFGGCFYLFCSAIHATYLSDNKRAIAKQLYQTVTFCLTAVSIMLLLFPTLTTSIILVALYTVILADFTLTAMDDRGKHSARTQPEYKSFFSKESAQKQHTIGFSGIAVFNQLSTETKRNMANRIDTLNTGIKSEIVPTN